MGNAVKAAFATRRFEGGKLPLKYWNEDVWPTVEVMFDKFSIEQTGGYEIFSAFISIEVDECGYVTTEECHDYIGERKTRYTERIFSPPPSIIGEEEKASEKSPRNTSKAPKGMTFEEFSILIWNYCSYSALQLARHIFEIYDNTNSGELERPDIESMYRMMFDRETHDPWIIDQFPFSAAGFINKAAFIKHCGSKRQLIQPAIVYQRRVRKKVGGVLYWGSVQSTRKKAFAIQDSESVTLEDALRAILRFEDLNKKNKKSAADTILANQKLKLLKEEEKRSKEWEQLMEAQKKEEEEKEDKRDDKKMMDAWDLYDRSLQEFEEDYFTTDDIWTRQEARCDLFEMLDTAIEESKVYWVQREATDIVLATGTSTDHEARLQEYLQTTIGALHYKYIVVRTVLEDVSATIAAKKGTRGKGKYAQSQKELAISMALTEVQATDYKKPVKFGRQFLEVEEPIAILYGTAKQFMVAEKKAHDVIFEWHQNKVMAELSEHQDRERNLRMSRNLIAEHDLVENHGSRITRWESVIDHVNKRRVYANIDTLEIIHRNSAICEKCDYVFEQSDEKCSKCESLRSSKNGKLYRPFGYQNICVD